MATVEFDLTASEIDGIRVDGTALKLDWNEFDADANTMLLIHANEASWSGAGAIIDSSGLAHHGDPEGGLTTDFADPWLGTASPDFAGSEYGAFPYHADLDVLAGNNPFTFETWSYIEGTDVATRYIWGQYANGGTPRNWLRMTSGVYQTLLGGSYINFGSVLYDQWVHLLIDYDGTTLTSYINGVYGDSAARTVDENATGSYHWGLYWEGSLEDTRISNIRRQTGAFTPHRYVDGSAVLVDVPSESYRLTDIAWTGTFGTDGKVAAVYVNEGTDAVPSWTAVGGADPTSPISGLDYIILSTVTKPIKVTLAPKADALQSATPELATLTMTTAPVGIQTGLFHTQSMGRRFSTDSLPRRFRSESMGRRFNTESE